MSAAGAKSVCAFFALRAHCSRAACAPSASIAAPLLMLEFNSVYLLYSFRLVRADYHRRIPREQIIRQLLLTESVNANCC